MGVSKEQVSFVVHPAMEFIHGLNFIANEEALYKLYLDFNFSPSEAFRESVKEMENRLSRFIKGELAYFLGWPDMESILGRIILENESVKQAPDLIAFLNRISEKELQSHILCQGLYGITFGLEDRLQWMTCEYTAKDLKKMVEDADDKSDESKERLMECIENPSEFRSRLCFLLAQFYEKCYAPIEGKILAELAAAKERYSKLFAEDPDCFNNEYLGKSIDALCKKHIIHISHFKQIRAWMFNVKSSSNVRIISLGIHSEHYPRKIFIKAKVQKFVKILSDKKRFEIIERLGKRPYYVYELSSELKLTSPTICYHLNAMLDLNLVSTDRENNKTFYTLNKAMVKELLDNASEILLEDGE